MLPFIAYAADSVDSLLYRLNAKIINPLIEIAFVIALVVFLFGAMEFIRGAGNEEKRTKGKQHMLWGVVGFFIMFSVFGIINLIIGTFDLEGVTVNKKEQKVEIPCIQDLRIDGENIGSIVPCN